MKNANEMNDITKQVVEKQLQAKLELINPEVQKHIETINLGIKNEAMDGNYYYNYSIDKCDGLVTTRIVDYYRNLNYNVDITCIQTSNDHVISYLRIDWNMGDDLNG